MMGEKRWKMREYEDEWGENGEETAGKKARPGKMIWSVSSWMHKSMKM